MKAKIIFTLVAAVLLMNGGLELTDSSRLTVLGGATAQAGPRQIDIGFFYEELAPYGYWRRYQPYGWVWYPNDVDDEWRPYTVGYWAFTDDFGWTWVSDEPWGWMTYHYGRWFYDDDYGSWAWMPGTVWGPAWVSWRMGDGFVGWAPLPPEVEFDPDVGFSRPRRDFHISWYAWSFVPEPELLSHRVRRSILPRPRNRAIIDRTEHFTDYAIVNRRVVNRGIDVDRFEREHRTRVIRHRAVDVERPTVGQGLMDEGIVPLFRPRVVERGTSARPPESSVAPPGVVPRRSPVSRDFQNETPLKPEGEVRRHDRPDLTESYRESRQRPLIEQPRHPREIEPSQPTEMRRRALPPEQRWESEPSQLPEMRRRALPPEQRRESSEPSQPPEMRRRALPPEQRRESSEPSQPPEMRRRALPSEPGQESEPSQVPEMRRRMLPSGG